MVNKKRILSLLLSLGLMVSPILNVYAGSDDINIGGGGGTGGGAWKGNTTWSNEEFIRASIYWSPLKGDQPDWTSDKVTQIGTAVDLRSSQFNSIKRGVVNYGDFANDADYSKNTAKYYNGKVPHETPEFSPTLGKGYNSVIAESSYVLGKTKEEKEANQADPSKKIQFPILFGSNKNGVDAREFFTQYDVFNQLLYSVQSAKGMPTDSPDWVNAQRLMEGEMPDATGVPQPGQFVIMIEPGMYVNSGGKGTALTLREILQMHQKGSKIFYDMVTPIRDMANSIFVKKTWEMLGLDGTSGADQIQGKLTENIDLMNRKFGIV